MFGKRAKQTDSNTTQMTVTLPEDLAGILKTMAADNGQDESKLVEQLLIEALIHVRGKEESLGRELSSPVVRLANAVLVGTIDSGADSVRVVPTIKGLIFRLHLNGEPIVLAGGLSEPLFRDLPNNIHQPLYARFEQMAGRHGIQYIRHPTAQDTGRIPITHSGKSYDIGVRFRSDEPDAISETLELTVAGPLEDH